MEGSLYKQPLFFPRRELIMWHEIQSFNEVDSHQRNSMHLRVLESFLSLISNHTWLSQQTFALGKVCANHHLTRPPGSQAVLLALMRLRQFKTRLHSGFQVSLGYTHLSLILCLLISLVKVLLPLSCIHFRSHNLSWGKSSMLGSLGHAIGSWTTNLISKNLCSLPVESENVRPVPQQDAGTVLFPKLTSPGLMLFPDLPFPDGLGS